MNLDLKLLDIYPNEDFNEYMYNKYINNIQTILANVQINNDNEYYIKSYIRGLFKDKRHFSKDLAELNTLIDIFGLQTKLTDYLISHIFQDFKQYGYVYQYFGFMNINNDLVKARLGELVLTPQTFELGVTTSLSNYEEILHTMNICRPFLLNFNPRNMQCGPLSDLYCLPILPKSNCRKNAAIPGWTKKALREAIINSGLGITDEKTDIMYFPADPILLKVTNTYKNTLPGIFNNVNRYVPHRVGMPAIHDIEGQAYMPRAYYEALYRKIYNTPVYINWSTYCETQEPKYLNLIKFMAINDFDFKPSEIRNLKFSELCELLNDESMRRRKFLTSLANKAIELAPEIIYQPGSIFVKPEIFKKQVIEKELKPEYQEIYNLCQDPQVTKGYLIYISELLGIRNYLPKNLYITSKEKICHIIKQYLKILINNEY